MTSLGLVFFGVFVGLLSGVLGIGGGIVLVPGLMVLFGFTQQEAQGTSLAVLIPPIGIFAAMVYYQNGFVRLPVVAQIAGGFLVGALLGAKLVPYIPEAALRLAFGLLLLYVGFTFVLDVQKSRHATALPAGIAAVVTAIGARLLGRRIAAKSAKLPPPSHDVDYHI